MRKIYFVLLSMCFATVVNAQNVTVSGALVGNGSYATLATAFTAINGGAQTAATITITIDATTTEPATGAILNAGTWTSVSIQPAGGAARTISGAVTAGLPLIDFNGADNVTIDGLNTGGNSLTIENTTVSATSGTSTIRFIGGAITNTIKRCFLKGAGTMSVATNGAIVFFSTDGVTASGNDNNTISNCDIGPSGANLPTKAILGNGSTTTTAIGNSGITINNNDIHDYFGAAVTSAGVATNGGCNTWTITNNRFYQTGTRTWTTGALHNAMNIGNITANSGAQGFTITGNIVGYASNTQTGVYTLTGSTGTFRGIVFNGITTGTVSTINSNTVAAISVTGVTSSGTSSSAPFMGIYVTNGVAIANSNTIGSQSATGSLIFSTSSASAADMMGMFNFSNDAWTANTNSIGGLTSSNAGAGAANVYGIRLNTSTTVTTTLNGNTVGGTVANSIQSTSTAAGAQVAGIFVSTSIATVSNNIVRNLTAPGGTGTTTAASVVGIDFINATSINIAIQNTIFNLTNTNTTAATVVTGIQFTGATGNVVEGNFIYGLSSATNSATAEINGIRVGGGTTTYRNNMIVLGAGVANAIGSAASNSGTSGINGINEFLGTDNFFHNSVYIGGSPTAGLGASYAFNGTQTVNTRSFRNNIFFNARSNSGATGKNYAVKVNGTTPNPTGLTINNNVYFANGTGALFGFFNSLDVANLAAWKTAVGQDAGSFESDPKYLSPAATTPDLHIDPVPETVVEGNGVDVGVINDYDGQTRASLTPVDIGADAGNFTGADLTAPAISYTALANSCGTGARILTATITDGSGVPTSGVGLPVAYFKINAGAYTPSAGTFVSGSTYIFSIGAGSVSGDVVSYYIVAQDMAGTPNVSAFPSSGAGGFTINPPAAAIPPTTPSSYTNLTTMAAGIYGVGGPAAAGEIGHYTTLTLAVTDYNTRCTGGNIIFALTDAGYTSAPTGVGETFPIVINANPSADGTHTLTIKPDAGVTSSISGNSAVAIIKLNGADYVTIDGSNNSSNTKDLTISNTNTATTGVVIWLGSASASNGACNNSVKNCIVTGNASTTTFGGIVSSSGTTMGGVAETANANNTYTNNTVNTCTWGIAIFGPTGNESGTVISNNLVGSAVAGNKIGLRGIAFFQQTGVSVTGNTVFGVSTATIGTASGIYVSGTQSGGTVTNNMISDVKNTNAGGFGSNGIGLYSSSATGNVTVLNNMINDVASLGFAGRGESDNGYGIMINTGGGYNIYYNSVSMSTSQTVAGFPAAINIAAVVTALDIRNNIFSNTETVGSRYGIINSGTAAAFTNINYNDYSAQNVGYQGGDQATLANWQSVSLQDAQSINVAPVFISATDLHLTASNCGIDGRGVPIAGITTDLDGAVRNTGAPDMGADEFTATLGTTLAVTVPGTTDNASYNVSPTGTVFSNSSCGIIAGVLPNGASPVSGLITSKVTMDATVQTYSMHAYLQRHFDITPAVNQSTATARVTMYVLQSEFDTYNANNGADPDLPAAPGDATGKSNLRVIKYSGNGTAPGNYVPGVATQINPNDADIVWDATNSWWTITVDVSGFSGLYIAGSFGVLPVSLLNFSGYKDGSRNQLRWTTGSEQNNSGFELQRSTDGVNYAAIGFVNTQALGGNSSSQLNYAFTDINVTGSRQYYRLRQVNFDGNSKLSNIVLIKGDKPVSLTIDGLFPNPSSTLVNVLIASPSKEKITLVVTDIAGRTVTQQVVSVETGSNTIPVDISLLTNGTYLVKLVCSSNCEGVLGKFVKQ